MQMKRIVHSASKRLRPTAEVAKRLAVASPVKERTTSARAKAVRRKAGYAE